MATGGIVDARALDQFTADVREFLSRRPRQLPSRYLYDGLGSALFDAICHLPWYGVTRAERRLLARDAHVVLSRGYRTLIELGPGNGSKLASLLAASQRPDDCRLLVYLVDVSSEALQQATRTLERFDEVQVVAHAAAYDVGLDAFAASRGRGPALVLFLGSNIGNFSPGDAVGFLESVRARVSAGDALLIGTDLVKPEARLLDAYDDPLGVTAAFNRNLLVRLQTELGASLDLDGFAHHVVWNADAARIEMHLAAVRSQRVVIEAAGLDFAMAAGETIWTESSYKYTAEGVRRMLETCGFRVDDQWIDRAEAFALTHAIAA